MTALLIDIALIVLIIFSVKNGAGKGLVKSVWRIAAWVLTIILVIALSKPAVGFLSETKIRDSIYETVHAAIDERAGNVDLSALDDNAISQTTGIPDMLLPHINTEEISNSINNTIDSMSHSVTMIIIKIIANLLLFLLIRILITILFYVLDGASRLPVINSVNKLLGGALGFVNMMLIIYLACAVIYLIASVNTGVYEIINGTFLVKYFYNNNILLQLFMKV